MVWRSSKRKQTQLHAIAVQYMIIEYTVQDKGSVHRSTVMVQTDP